MPENGELENNIYQIRVEGLLESHWSDWLQGMSITYEKGCVTLLTGPVVDQSALYGLLNKIRDLGLVLQSVEKLEY